MKLLWSKELTVAGRAREKKVLLYGLSFRRWFFGFVVNINSKEKEN